LDVPQLIPFAFAAVIMLWVAFGTYLAFTGGIDSGLPEILEPPENRGVRPTERDQAAD
jgi:hypothetical protein